MSDKEFAPDRYQLGKSLREHMADFVLTLRRFTESMPDIPVRPRPPMTIIYNELIDLLEFVDRESAFYAIDPASIVPGAYNLRLYSTAQPDGERGIMLSILVGEQQVASPVFGMDEAAALANAIGEIISIEGG